MSPEIIQMTKSSLNFSRWSSNSSKIIEIYRTLEIYDTLISVDRLHYFIDFYAGRNGYLKAYKNFNRNRESIDQIAIMSDIITIKHTPAQWITILKNDEENFNLIKKLDMQLPCKRV